MADVYTAIGTGIAAIVAVLSVFYMIFIKPGSEKFSIIFDRLHEHDKIIATVPGISNDIKCVRREVHELTNRFSELAQGVARIEGKLGIKEK